MGGAAAAGTLTHTRPAATATSSGLPPTWIVRTTRSLRVDIAFAVQASELRHPRDLRPYLDGVENAWDTFDHFWW